ncbi:hypothetical protein BU16DRAFT_450180 [Lophium mytilinum]|uniref:Uncharacterized protein n=1 Tax=Lophium mytilinum TaxID=390894 RepID=A0A6A6RBU1_9PEZI|nr:hypothetical protein BU16DRAFT_450180 [Lophium mytilinum]
MPPSTARGLLSRSSTCQLNAHSSVARRSFTSAPAVLALGPQSPNYVEVPKPVQPTFPLKPRLKGVLPVPRNIFRTRGDKKKASDEFLNAATKEPSTIREHKGKDVAYQDYKLRLAETRRRNLKQSVKELHEREVESHRQMDAISTRKQEEHLALVNQPERDDERLTNPSVSKDIMDYMSGKLDARPPLKWIEQDIEIRRTRFQKMQQKKEAARLDALHTLYMQARDFITTEKQLDEAIDKVFGTPENPVTFGLTFRDSSPWASEAPPTVRDMLNRQGLLDDVQAGQKGKGTYDVMNDRLKKIAEDLTGGKI